MQYDFNVLPNGTQAIDVAGKFFKYKDGTGLIRVRLTKGGYVDLMPGQGVWNTEFSSLSVQDRTGADNSGVILAGWFDFQDDRIVGTVDVVDGGKNRTLANQAFTGVIVMTPAATQYSNIHLFNPAGSNRNIYLEQFIVSSNTAGEIGGYIATAQVPNNVGGADVGKSKKAGGANSVCQTTTNTAAGANAFAAGNKLVIDAYVQASQSLAYKFSEPIMLGPGTGFTITHLAANATLIGTLEYFEEQT